MGPKYVEFTFALNTVIIAIGVIEGVALAGGELAHIGGIKTRTRELFLKTTPEKKNGF